MFPKKATSLLCCRKTAIAIAIYNKYYLDSKQYDKFSPPDLLGTKLHLLEGLDFSGLSSRLQVTHSKLRDVVKVQLKHFQSLGEMQIEPVYDVYDDQGSLNVQYELSDMSAYTVDGEDVDRSINLPSDSVMRISRN